MFVCTKVELETIWKHIEEIPFDTIEFDDEVSSFTIYDGTTWTKFDYTNLEHVIMVDYGTL